MGEIMFFILMICSIFTREALVDHVDLIELNHFYDDNGRLVLDQLIYYDWSYEDNRFQVRAWRLFKKDSQLPVYNSLDKNYAARWYDGQILRKVYAKHFRETWTYYDPELTEREFLGKDKRRELRVLGKQ